MASKEPTAAVPARAPAPGSARLGTAIREQQRLLAQPRRPLEAAGVEDMHGGRVAARRLRSILKTFRPLLEPRRARLYRADLRSFARALGAVREADVRRELLVALARADAAITPGRRAVASACCSTTCASPSRENLRRHSPSPAGPRCAPRSSGIAPARRCSPCGMRELGEVVALVARAWRRPVRLLRAQADRVPPSCTNCAWPSSTAATR